MGTHEPYAKELNNLLDEMQIEALREQYTKVKELMTYYHCAMLEMETKLNVLNEQFALQNERNPIDSIKSRLKSMSSIQDKLRRQGHSMNIDNIEEFLSDVAGIRVICSFIDDIYMLADCLREQDDIEILACKDYIKNPKPNGYRSLHLIVQIPIFLQNEKRLMRVEVQLRTIAMEFWANLEHKLRYKKSLGEKTELEIEQGLKECADISAELDAKMYEIRNKISN